MGYIVEDRKRDGGYQRWDLDLHLNFRRARNIGPKDHPAIQHHFLKEKFQRGNDTVVFTKIVKHWHGGYYLYGVFEVNNSGSHGTAVIENINCIDPIILESLAEFHNNFKLIK